eukprot:468150-Pyramimonas_sp.AAC.1
MGWRAGDVRRGRGRVGVKKAERKEQLVGTEKVLTEEGKVVITRWHPAAITTGLAAMSSSSEAAATLTTLLLSSVLLPKIGPTHSSLMS